MAGSAAGLVWSDQHPRTGEIVLEQAPFCDFVVVKTHLGYSFLEVSNNIVVISSGNQITGPLTSKGHQSLSVDGRAIMQARVLSFEMDWQRAKMHFDRLCPPDNPTEEVTNEIGVR
jgi:hypothetical protein